MFVIVVGRRQGRRERHAHAPRRRPRGRRGRAEPRRYDALEEEFGHRASLGDATELYVLERAGIKRPPDIVVAVTGDDEDNIVICQLAKELYGVAEGRSRA